MEHFKRFLSLFFNFIFDFSFYHGDIFCWALACCRSFIWLVWNFNFLFYFLFYLLFYYFYWFNKVLFYLLLLIKKYVCLFSKSCISSAYRFIITFVPLVFSFKSFTVWKVMPKWPTASLVNNNSKQIVNCIFWVILFRFRFAFQFNRVCFINWMTCIFLKT